MLLDFVVHQTNEFYGSTTPSDGFFLKLLLAILGPFIGVGGSLYLYNKKNNSDKEKETNVLKQENNNLLNYFASLTTNIYRIFKDQRDLIKPFAERKTSEPFALDNGLGMKVNIDIDRLEKLDQIKIFHAYLMRFGNSEAIIKQFTQLYSALDYLFLIKPDLLAKVEKDHAILLDLSDQFVKQAESAKDLCLALVGKGKRGELQPSYKDMWSFINAELERFGKRVVDAGGVHTIPEMKEELLDKIKFALVKDHWQFPEVEPIIMACSRAGNIHKQIVQYQNQSSEIFINLYNKIKDTLEKLEPIIPLVQVQ